MLQGPLGERIPFEGVLNCWNDDHDLPDLLLAISRSGKTGRLHFSNPEGDKTLDLCEGKVVFAESSSQDDGLGQFLLRTGEISLMDYTRVSKMVQPGKRLGALLVEEHVLHEENLTPAVVGQVRSIILGLFRRTESWYRFKEEALEPQETITLDLAVPELVLEGVSYVESWRRISKGVGNLESVYHQAAAYEREWSASALNREVRELISMLASPTSLAEICEHASIPDFEACRYLWALRALGWIDLVDVAAQVAVPTSVEQTPPAQAQAQAPAPAVPPPIPEHLIETQVSVTPPSELDKINTVPPLAAPSPPQIPEHLNQTQLSIDPPPETPLPPPKAILQDLLNTQMFEEPFSPEAPSLTDEPDLPSSTGEFMESILEGQAPSPPKPPAPQPPAPTPAVPPPRVEEPPAPTPPANHAATQFFEGASALAPEPAPQPRAQPQPEAPQAPAPAGADAPSGFEALALGDDLAPPNPPSVAAPPSSPPNPADVATQPSLQPAASADTGMASFSDLALSDNAFSEPTPAPDAPLPWVEADVVAVEPPVPEPAPVESLTAPPQQAPYVPDEPLLPRSRDMEITQESLVPPRRRTDVLDADPDELSHALGIDKK
jgi:hypothetical protein